MDWQTYRKLSAQPNCFTRWALEQTVRLVDDASVQAVLRRTLVTAPLSKPADHLGDPRTDQFPVALDQDLARLILRELEQVAEDGPTRHLLVTWREYAASLAQ